jgi:hypothetical protein
MENNKKQQEVLFVSNSSFFRQELYQRNLRANYMQLAGSAVDKLEEACWNGMLRRWLPQVNQNTDNNELFLWKVLVANSFLCGELSRTPSEIERSHSLNPYLFFSSINNN